METPPLVDERLEGETVRARVDLDGNDAAFVTPTRTLVYRSEGLLSDETVETYGHRVDRVELETGRRKATLRLVDIDGTETLRLPSSRLGDVLEPMLEGILVESGVIEPAETVESVYRFSELTLVVTDARVLKHVGVALWDDDHEAIPFEDVIGLDTEEGHHATGLVIETRERSRRVKIPADEARVVARAVENAILAYHDVSSISELADRAGVDPSRTDSSDATAGFQEPDIRSLVSDDDGGVASEPEPEPEPETGAEDPFEPLGGDEGSLSDSRSAGDRTGPAAPDDREAGIEGELLDRIADLEAELDRQTELLERQGELIERLVRELRRGR